MQRGTETFTRISKRKISREQFKSYTSLALTRCFHNTIRDSVTNYFDRRSENAHHRCVCSRDLLRNENAARARNSLLFFVMSDVRRRVYRAERNAPSRIDEITIYIYIIVTDFYTSPRRTDRKSQIFISATNRLVYPSHARTQIFCPSSQGQ